MQQCMYETTIRDIDDLRKRLMQIWFGLNMTLSTLHLISGTTVCMRSCVACCGGHFEHVL